MALGRMTWRWAAYGMALGNVQHGAGPHGMAPGRTAWHWATYSTQDATHGTTCEAARLV